jgi:hypothetical protein
MTEIESAQKCAEIYTAIAAGKTVLVSFKRCGSLQPYEAHLGPTVLRIRTGWRFIIKEEDAPGTVWAVRSKVNPECFTCTSRPETAEAWRNQGAQVEIYNHAGTHFRTGEVGLFIPAPKSHESEERGKL